MNILIPIIIIVASLFICGLFLRKKTYNTYNNKTVSDAISRAKMNLDPKWNKGCVRDSDTGRFLKK